MKRHGYRDKYCLRKGVVPKLGKVWYKERNKGVVNWEQRAVVNSCPTRLSVCRRGARYKVRNKGVVNWEQRAVKLEDLVEGRWGARYKVRSVRR